MYFIRAARHDGDPEMFTHLELLVKQGVLKRDNAGGVNHYVVA